MTWGRVQRAGGWHRPADRLLMAVVAMLMVGILVSPAYGSVRAVCAVQAREQERAERIPPGLVLAVATAESGRWSAEDKATRPWPWTVTSGKDSFYLPSKNAAIAKVEALKASGRTNIDVGCMQINLHYHPDAFASLDDAFDPISNVAYGTRFLKKLRMQTRSWGKATAYYHSQDRARGNAYRTKVYGFWRNLRQRSKAGSEPTKAVASSSRPGAPPILFKDRVKRPFFSRRPSPLWRRDAIPVLRGG